MMLNQILKVLARCHAINLTSESVHLARQGKMAALYSEKQFRSIRSPVVCFTLVLL